MAGRALVIIGTSAAGKTSLATAFQDAAPTHYLRLGIDTFFAAVSERWAGGPRGPFRSEGFEYVAKDREDGAPVLRITYGDVGWRVIRGMHDAVAALARAGNDVVFDDMPLDARALLDWRRALAGVPASIVLLDVPLTVLLRREEDRRARDGHSRTLGLARGHVELMQEVEEVDLRLDGSLPLDRLTADLIAHVTEAPTTPPGHRGIHLSLR